MENKFMKHIMRLVVTSSFVAISVNLLSMTAMTAG